MDFYREVHPFLFGDDIKVEIYFGFYDVNLSCIIVSEELIIGEGRSVDAQLNYIVRNNRFFFTDVVRLSNGHIA